MPYLRTEYSLSLAFVLHVLSYCGSFLAGRKHSRYAWLYNYFFIYAYIHIFIYIYTRTCISERHFMNKLAGGWGHSMDQWQWYHSQSGPLAFASTRCNSLSHLQSVCPVPLYFLLSCSSSIFLSSYHPISKASLSFYIPPLIFASSDINLSLSHSTWLNTKGLRALLDPTKRDNKTTTTNYIHSCIAQESETMWRTAVRANSE